MAPRRHMLYEGEFPPLFRVCVHKHVRTSSSVIRSTYFVPSTWLLTMNIGLFCLMGRWPTDADPPTNSSVDSRDCSLINYDFFSRFLREPYTRARFVPNIDDLDSGSSDADVCMQSVAVPVARRLLLPMTCHVISNTAQFQRIACVLCGLDACAIAFCFQGSCHCTRPAHGHLCSSNLKRENRYESRRWRALATCTPDKIGSG